MRAFERIVLSSAALGVLLYSAAVIYHVRTTYDLGVHCLMAPDTSQLAPFGPEVGRVDSAIESRLAPDRPEAGPVPRVGDTLERVAQAPVPTFTHFRNRLLTLNDLRSAEAEPQAGLVFADGSWWARVEFVPQDARDEASAAASESIVHVTWLKLKPATTGEIIASLVWCLAGLAMLAIGALVVFTRPGDWSASLFFMLCAVSVVTFLGAFHWSTLAGSTVLSYPMVLCGMLLPAMLLHFFVLFPRPLWMLRRWPRRTLAAIYVLPVSWMLATLAALLMLDWRFLHDASAAEIVEVQTYVVILIYTFLGLAMLLLLVGHAALVYGYLHSRTLAERRQVRWILGALVIASLPLGCLVYLAITDRSQFAYGEFTKWSVYGISMMFTMACAVSITRYKLRHVGRLATRGIQYVAISFAASAAFCLLVGVATALVGKYYFSWENALAAGLTAMMVVVSLSWIRERVQRALDQRFRHEKYQLDTALDRLSRAVDQLVEPSQLAGRMLQSAMGAVGATRGAVYLRGSDGAFELAADNGAQAVPESLVGERPLVEEACREGVLVARGGRQGSLSEGQQQLRDLRGELCLALEQDGQAEGLVLLGPKSNGVTYTGEDRNFLLALARTTTLALQSAQGYRTIEALKDQLHEKVETIAQQQRQIRMLQGQLLSRERVEGAAAQEPAATGDKPPGPGVDQLRQVIRGSSPVVQRMLRGVAKIADSNSSVLVRGESGTGKGLLARAIHSASPRAGGPFVTVHCAALSQSLLESELFGHAKGAFTGADRDKIGRFEMADGGTLFLDEIGDIRLETQTKLLRVLQEKALERVGEVKTRHVDVRLIAATHRDLEELIRQEQFREDLYYRLNVISIECPPLRERKEDLFELAAHFLHIYAARAGKRIVRIEDDALQALAEYSWPGNIRQLENAIERAVVLAEGDALRREDLPPEILAAEAGSQTLSAAARVVPVAEPAADQPAAAALESELLGLERARIAEVLERCGGNKSLAARQLGMPRSTLFSRLKRLGLE